MIKLGGLGVLSIQADQRAALFAAEVGQFDPVLVRGEEMELVDAEMERGGTDASSGKGEALQDLWRRCSI